MTPRSAVHGTFVIRRTLAYGPDLVFAAWASPAGKSQWLVGPPGWHEQERRMDFRVGGQERLVGSFPNGKVHTFDARYLEIQPRERIIYSYEMHLNDVRISISLATIEFKTKGSGTELVITEQGVFLDGYDDLRSRERGTQILTDQLERCLQDSLQ
jgi:uncharacterized protein YndB with AHSA1/START domain